MLMMKMMLGYSSRETALHFPWKEVSCLVHSIDTEANSKKRICKHVKYSKSNDKLEDKQTEEAVF
jgi:hypothetical protein